MSNILFVNACIRENSRTLELANYVLSKLNGDVEELKLYDKELFALDLEGLKLRESASSNNDYSDDVFNFAKQFASADIIVFAAPYWDLMFPAIVKTYLENVTVSGLTFFYGEDGIPKGLCKGKKLIYVTTAGGPIIHNYGYEYIETLAKTFYGINDVSCVSAEGLDIIGADVISILNKAKDSFVL